jgi:hypothetical protein
MDNMDFDWNLGPLADGLRCYRREEFFAAHEHWEILWRQCQGPEKSFLQALIQMAGAFHHLQRNNLQGAEALLKAALRRLDPYPERFEGVQVAPLRQEGREWLQMLQLQEPRVNDPAIRPAYPQIRLDLPAVTPGEGHRAI